MLLRADNFKNLDPKAVCNNIAIREEYHGFIIEDNKKFEFFRPAILENTLAEDGK